MFTVVGRGVKVGENHTRIKARNSFDVCVLASELAGAAAVRAKPAQQVGSDHDESLPSQLVGHLFCPVAETEDLVDQNHHRSLGFHLGVHNQGLNAAAAVLKCDVFTVARGSVEACLGPVLRRQGSGEHGKQQEDSRIKGAGKRDFHGPSLAAGKIGWQAFSQHPGSVRSLLL